MKTKYWYSFIFTERHCGIVAPVVKELPCDDLVIVDMNKAKFLVLDPSDFSLEADYCLDEESKVQCNNYDRWTVYSKKYGLKLYGWQGYKTCLMLYSIYEKKYYEWIEGSSISNRERLIAKTALINRKSATIKTLLENRKEEK